MLSFSLAPYSIECGSNCIFSIVTCIGCSRANSERELDQDTEWKSEVKEKHIENERGNSTMEYMYLQWFVYMSLQSFTQYDQHLRHVFAIGMLLFFSRKFPNKIVNDSKSLTEYIE